MSKAASFVVAAVGFAVAPWAAGLGGTILGYGVGTIASKLATTVALSALSRAISTQKATGGSAGIKTSQTLTGETNPEAIVLGWTATAGQALCPPMSHGKNNRYMTHVIELCSAPGATLSRLMIGSQYVTLGAEDSEYGRPVTSGDYAGLVWVKYYDGRQTAADPMLMAKYGTYPDRPWQADMVGHGICYAILTFCFHDKRLTSIPKYLFEMVGIPLYDPRQDSTNGGNGAQRWSNPLTWTQTVNPAVICYNLMRGITLPGGDVYGGRAESADVPLAVWIAGMNVCDQWPAGGSAPQYRGGMEVSLDSKPAEVIEEFLKGASADIADVAGIWKVRFGGPGLPVMTISDDDVIVSKEQTLDPFPALDSTYNGVTATYPDPDGLWQGKEAPARYNADLEAADRFGRKVADLQLNAVPWLDQVQQVMRSYIEAERRFSTHRTTLPPRAAALELLDVIAWTSTRNGYDLKQFETTETVDDLMTCRQGEALKEVDPSDYDWSPSFSLPTTPSAPGYTLPAPEQLLGWDFQADVIKDNTGAIRRPALRMFWDADLLADGVEWEIRLLGATTAWPGSTQAVGAGGAQISDGVLGDTTYQARARPIIAGRETAWTDWTNATTSNIQLTMADLAGDMRDWLDGMLSWAGEARDRMDQAEDIIANAIEAAAQGWLQMQMTGRHLRVSIDTVQAEYTEKIAVIAEDNKATAIKIEALETSVDQSAADIIAVQQATSSADAALAEQISTVSARLGAASASGTFQATAEIGPAGVLARIALRALASTGEAISERQAAIFLEALANGLSRAVILSDRFAIANGDGRVFPFIISDGMVYMDKVMIAEASIDTLKVAGNSITTMVATEANDTRVITSIATTLEVSFTANVGDSLIIVAACNMMAGAADSSSATTVSARVLMNGGSIVAGTDSHTSTTTSPSSVSSNFSLVATALYSGTHTVTLQNAGSTSGGGGAGATRTVSGRRIAVLKAMR